MSRNFNSLCLLLFFALGGPCFAAKSESRPNVIFILTDNHGAWTLGCYGNKEIRTPHIDRLAAEGTLMTRAFSSNPVCSPTRATFLTGLMPSQHGVHCFLRGGRLQIGPDARNTLEEFQSLPEIFKAEGYRCGLVGKWHLGENLTPQEGLDDYWITMPHGGTTEFYDATIIENGKQRKEPKYLTEFWTDHAIQFVEQDDERPFFLYLAYNGPYALGRLLLDEGHNRHAEFYRDAELTSFPNEPTHPWQFNNLDYFHNPISSRRVASEVSGIDDGVGRLMQTLQQHGLDDNTLIVFAADQGWSGGHGGFYGMGDHTRPVTATDPMMQIPMIWWHPNGIAQQKSDAMVSNYDLFPTLLSYLGLSEQIVSPEKLPGRDFSTILKGEKASNWKNEVFYEFEFLRTIRTEDWKLTLRHPNGPHELFDLENDPGEGKNLYNRGSSEVQQQLKERLSIFFERFNSSKYDLLNGGGSQTVLFNPPLQPLQDPKTQGEEEEPGPFDLSETIKVPVGYTVEKVASSKLVQHPMMAGFDDRGRLFVSESAGLNLRNNVLEEELPNSIKMLEDIDGDGTFDKSTLFADKMTLPMGACWYRDSLYVASPPHIWRLQDTDDDGIADVREKFSAKFGYNGNAASVHGCFLSPTGRIYWCDGRHGHELLDEQGQPLSKRAGSYIFSALPDGRDLQIHCGGGMDNPVEVDFTETGDVLGTVNILYSGPRSDCLVHWLHGGTYPHSQRVLGELKRTGPLLGPIHQFGHVAVSGTCRYRSGIFDRSFRDNMFVTIFNTGQLLRVELQEEGSTYRAQQHEFLTCSHPDFHPTDVLEDADGSLLLVDTGGWFRIGCPTSQVAKPDIKGGIYRIRRTGMPEYVAPRGQQTDWDSLSNRQLIMMCMDTRFTVREQAIERCAQRGNPLLADARTWIVRGDIPVRRNLVWACTRMRTSNAEAVVRLALNDRDASVRAAACLSAGVNRDANAVEELIELLADPSHHVRRAALAALGKIGDAQAVPAILNHARQNMDRAEDHALIYALMEIGATAEIKSGLHSDHNNIQRVALQTLQQIAPEELAAVDVFSLLDDASSSEQLANTAINTILTRPEWRSHVTKCLQQWHAGEKQLSNNQVSHFIQHFVESPSLQQLIPQMLLNSSEPRQLAILEGLRQSQLKSIPDSMQPVLRQFLSSRNDSLIFATLYLLKGRAHPFHEILEQIAMSEKLPDQHRLAAIVAEPALKQKTELTSYLLKLANTNNQNAIADQAVTLLRGINLNDKQYSEVLNLIESAGPVRISELVEVASSTKQSKQLIKLSEVLSSASSRHSISAKMLERIIQRLPVSHRAGVMKLIDEMAEMEKSQREKLVQLEPLAKSGSPKRGKEFFFSEKTKCATCHRIGVKGGKIGPDLSAIGLIRREKDLLEAILFPSNSFAREYEPHSVVTTDGRVVSGLISQETIDSIFLQQATGEPVEIERSQIEAMKPGTVSIMPKGLESGMSEQELADLVAYLRSLTNPQRQHNSTD